MPKQPNGKPGSRRQRPSKYTNTELGIAGSPLPCRAVPSGTDRLPVVDRALDDAYLEGSGSLRNYLYPYFILI